MARMKGVEQEKKQQQAREMYIAGFALSFISETVSVKTETLKVWAEKNQWENIKRAKLVTPNEIKNSILATFVEIKEGRNPIISPDKIAKLASAFEKLSNKEVALGYMVDSFTELQTFILKKAQLAIYKSNKEKFINIAKSIQPITEELLQEKFKKMNNE